MPNNNDAGLHGGTCIQIGNFKPSTRLEGYSTLIHHHHTAYGWGKLYLHNIYIYIYMSKSAVSLPGAQNCKIIYRPGGHFITNHRARTL